MSSINRPTPGVIKKLLVNENSLVDTPANGDDWVEVRKNKGSSVMANSKTVEFLKREFGIDVSSNNKDETAEQTVSSEEDSSELTLEKKSEELVLELEKAGKPMQRPKLLALLEQISKLTMSALQSAKGENQKSNGEGKMSGSNNENMSKAAEEPTLSDVMNILKANQEEIKQLKEDISKSKIQETSKETSEEVNKNLEGEKEISDLEAKVSDLKKNISNFETNQSEKLSKKDERIENLKKEVESLTKKYENIKKVREGSVQLDEEPAQESLTKSVWANSAIGAFVNESIK